MGAHLNFRDPQPPQPGQFAGRDFIRPGFNHQAHVAVRRGLIVFLQFVQPGRFGRRAGLGRGRAGVVQGFKAAPDKPFLIVAAVCRPGAAQDQQFNFIGRVSNRVQGLQARMDLAVRVKAVLQAAARAGLVRQVAFGHARFGRAEDTFARAGVLFGQHSHRGDPAEGSDGFHADARQQRRVSWPFPAFHQLVISGDENMLGQVAAPRQRVAAHRQGHIPAAFDLLQYLAGMQDFFRCVPAQFQPVFRIVWHTKLISSSSGRFVPGCLIIRW